MCVVEGGRGRGSGLGQYALIVILLAIERNFCGLFCLHLFLRRSFIPAKVTNSLIK